MASVKRVGLSVGLAWLAALLTAILFRLPIQAQSGVDLDKLQQGARLYADNCAVCHGENGQGRVGATLAKNWPSIRPELTVENIIVNGVPGSAMPAWSQANGGPLSTAEVEALVYYILSWSAGGPPEIDLGPTPTLRPVMTPPPDVTGDPNAGAVLYDQNCAVCHGANGEGRVGATLDKVWSSIRPDLSVKNVVSNGISGSAMPAWSQANGGPLSETQINDLTAFVLTWQETAPAAPTQVVQPVVNPPTVAAGTSWVFWVVGLGILLGLGALLALQRR
jgi:mono/diheme cytochrome c family protein